MKRIVFLVVLSTFAAVTAAAQSVTLNTKFGKVSKEEVEMLEYPLDTAATAVMLYDKRSIMVDLNGSGDFMQTIDRHMRIKILKEDGLDWGDFELLRYVGTSNREDITGIEVITYNLDDGKVVSTKMDKDFIYEDEYSSDYRKVSFYAQDVKVGSVIEVKYKLRSTIYWSIQDLYFQRTIPVNLSESEVRIPGMFTFHKKLRGSHHVDYASDIEHRALGSYQYEIGVDKFVAVDIPAFKYEPYIYYPEQYFSAVSYDIRTLSIPPSVYREYSVTWGDVDVSYRDSDIMTRFRSHCHFKDQVAALPKDGNDIQKIESVVNLVKNNVEWNGEYDIMPSPLGQVVKARSGSNADINCLIAGCLREMGYTVEMVMVKLRTSGHLVDFQPERLPYDTFVVGVLGADGTCYYLDGGSTNGYINVLPSKFLVPNARLIKNEGAGEWIDLTRLSRNGSVMSVTASLTDDFRLEGEAVTKHTGNPAYSSKLLYKEYSDDEEYIADLESENSIDIDELTLDGMNEYSSSATIGYTFMKDLDVAGEYVYVTPFIEAFHSKDTFQSLKREYPIDFPFPYSLTYRFTLTLPEGYTVDQLPENRNFKFDPLGLSVRCISAVQGNGIQVVYNFTQAKTFCEAVHYPDVRTLWQYLAEMYESMIVLKKL